MTWLIEPLSYAFMRSGLSAAILVGLLCGALGPYIVLRRVSYVGHALAHSALPGLVVAHAFGWPLSGGALAANALAGVGIARLSRGGAVTEDSSVALFSNAFFAAGILLMSRFRTGRDISHLLFGNILGVSGRDLVFIAGVSALVVGCLLFFYKEWELICFDPIQARLMGIPVERLRAILFVLLVLTIVAGIQVVGAALTSALLVAPASGALLVTRRLSRAIVLSCAVGVGSGVCGLFFSYYFGWPSGAAIVLFASGAYASFWVLCRRFIARRGESHGNL